MSYQPLVATSLAFNANGVPYSPVFNDIYHSDSGGLEQAQHVFIVGNGLPQAWQGREQFIILETGFGPGLNFLATWQAWRDDPQRSARLHFVSVEKHPFVRHDLARLHGQWPQLAAPAKELQSQWPVLTPGIHRLLLDGGRVTLTLLFGDAVTQIRKLSLHADALYLDGFAPGKNPQLWDKQFLKAVTRLCKPGATLATWTVAASVRESLTSLRWTVHKRPGFGSKRDMLCGRLFKSPVHPEPFGEAQDRLVEGPFQSTVRSSTGSDRTKSGKYAIVIGAGIAGTSIAERLAARGWRIELLERQPGPAREASGNPVGLLHPMLAKDDNLAARISRAGYLYALRLLAQLDREDLGLRWDQCGVLQLARDATQEKAQRNTCDALGFPDDYVAFLDQATAAQQAGHAVAAGAWFYPAGAIVDPRSLCHALLARHREAITARFNTEVVQLRRVGDTWLAMDGDSHVIGEAPVVIVANAFDASRLIAECNLPISRLRGQISVLPHDSLPLLRHALCGNGYVTPDKLGESCIGATFDIDDDDSRPRENSHRFNLERLNELLPGAALSLNPSPLEGRVGFRTLAIDRMPIVGALPDTTQPLSNGAQLRDVQRLPGLYGLLALGSRGLSWGPLAAELLAARLDGEPLPLERDLIAAIDPGRFLIRAQRRSFASNLPDL